MSPRCALCDGTGWRVLQVATVRRASRCLCWHRAHPPQVTPPPPRRRRRGRRPEDHKFAAANDRE